MRSLEVRTLAMILKKELQRLMGLNLSKVSAPRIFKMRIRKVALSSLSRFLGLKNS